MLWIPTRAGSRVGDNTRGRRRRRPAQCEASSCLTHTHTRRPPPAATMPRAADGSALLLPSPLSSSVSPNSAAADPAWVIFRVVYAVIALAGVAGSQAVVWWLLQRGTDARWGHTDRPAWNYLCVGWAVSACFGAPLLVRSGLAQLRQLRGMDLRWPVDATQVAVQGRPRSSPTTQHLLRLCPSCRRC
eukprot:COSAG01_NODE_24782_length_766_cov_4.881559_1_plen_188_part_00